MKSAGLEAGGNDGQVIASYNFFGGVIFVLCYLMLPQHTSCQVTGIVIKHRRTAAMYITSPRDEILKKLVCETKWWIMIYLMRSTISCF